MVATDLLPLSRVDGSGFRRVMKFAEPGYQMPHIKAITTRIEKRYKECAVLSMFRAYATVVHFGRNEKS